MGVDRLPLVDLVAAGLRQYLVFMPREPVFAADGSIEMMVFKPEVIIAGAVLMAAMMAYIFKVRGGEIQKIVLSKTHTTDIAQRPLSI